MEKSEKNVKVTKTKGSTLVSGLIILLCLIVGFTVWYFIMGNPANFEDNDPSKNPLEGNFLGVIYKGGPIVSVLMGLLLTTIVFSIERLFVIGKSTGKGNLDKFVNGVQRDILDGKIDEAMAKCDKQQGSVGNVIYAALVKFKEVSAENVEVEKACELIQKEIEDATTLEMPMLQKNMMIISTMISIGTLIGLLGTVTGMIRAFAALATAGTPDQAQLATGISEALVNTATGIGTSTLAIISYNYFSSKIDTLTYFIDEAGFALSLTYRRLHG